MSVVITYSVSDETYIDKGEIEIPARILDLLRSFIDSSTKYCYTFNNPPYRKIMQDGSYWQVKEEKIEINSREKDAICLNIITWSGFGKFCVVSNNMLIKVYGKKIIEAWSYEKDLDNIMLISKNRDYTLSLFSVYRKLLFYNYLIEKHKK